MKSFMKLEWIIVRNRDNRIVDSMTGSALEASSLTLKWNRETGEGHTVRRPSKEQWASRALLLGKPGKPEVK